MCSDYVNYSCTAVGSRSMCASFVPTAGQLSLSFLFDKMKFDQIEILINSSRIQPLSIDSIEIDDNSSTLTIRWNAVSQSNFNNIQTIPIPIYLLSPSDWFRIVSAVVGSHPPVPPLWRRRNRIPSESTSGRRHLSTAAAP